MPDKDKSERLKYLEEELRKQNEKLSFHKKHIEILENSVKLQKDEIKYNKGWVKFHNDSILKHKRQINYAKDDLEKADQIRKLAFHMDQIKNHHNTCIDYHKRELSYTLDWIRLSEEALSECNFQIKFLEDKIASL